jgi:6-phosphogluconolactonase
MVNTVNCRMMEKPRILVFETLDEMALKALQWLTAKTNLLNKETVSIALSGGNTPQVLFEKIVELDAGTVDWNKLLIFWGDERCVPLEHTDSNFRSAQKSILIPLDIPEDHIFRIHGEADPEMEAERYSQLLVDHLPIVDGFPQLDLILLGLGEDGHTASIFQDDKYLFASAQFCSVTKHPISSLKRITLTGSLINHASEVAFLVTGTPKAGIVTEIIQKSALTNYPAAKVAPISGKLIWLLDKASASSLNF